MAFSFRSALFSNKLFSNNLSSNGTIQCSTKNSKTVWTERGSDAPCALGNLYSIGSIAMESNGKIQSAVTDFLEEFGLEENRMYINFFDMPRANVGWSRRTFAG